MKIRLLIFDWDGTLSDSLQRIVDCLRQAAEDMGMPPPSPDEAKNIVGLGLYDAVECLFPGIDRQVADQLAQRYSHHYAERDSVPCDFFPGVKDTLDQLLAEDYILAVATGKSRRGLTRVLRTLQMESYFHGSRCADETRSKPHPLMLEQLLAEFSVDAGSALMVGDTTYDMEMAQRAGISGIGVSYGAHDVKRLHDYSPLVCIDQFSEIVNFLQNR